MLKLEVLSVSELALNVSAVSSCNVLSLLKTIGKSLLLEEPVTIAVASVAVAAYQMYLDFQMYLLLGD